jgi:hypothetical protein
VLLATGPLGGRPRPVAGLLAGTIVHADAQLPAARAPAVERRVPVCASASPHGDFALVAVIARPRASSPRMTPGAYRALVAAANGLVFQQAEESGAPGADLVFDCDAAGMVRVDDVTLPTPLERTSFESVVADLAALGYDRPDEKYVVWLDGRPPAAPCGSADIVSDQEPGDGNRTAHGPDWAVSFDCNSILHETMHVLGAVGLNAPHGTGAGHCWDGDTRTDVMCYLDGGASGPPAGRAVRCPGSTLHLDCGHDDYFAAGPVPRSSYLASHWNVAGCYDRFVVDYGCPGIAPSRAAPPALSVVVARRSGGGSIRVTVLLTSAPRSAASVAYSSPAGSGRLVFRPGSRTATLDIPSVRAGIRLAFTDPRGLWLRSSLVKLP